MENNILPGDLTLPSSFEELNELTEYELQKKWKYSVEDFFRIPEMSMFKISPDGKFLSYLAPYKRRKNIRKGVNK